MVPRVRAGGDEGRELVPKPTGRRYAVRVREVWAVGVMVDGDVWMGHLRKRRRRRELLVRLRTGRRHRVLPPPFNGFSSRNCTVTFGRIRAWRCRNRLVLVLHPLMAQIRYPRSRTRIRTYIAGSAPHAAALAALGRRALLGRGRTRLGAFSGSCRVFGGGIGDVKLVPLVLPILYLIRLIGRVIKRTNRIPVPSSIRVKLTLSSAS